MKTITTLGFILALVGTAGCAAAIPPTELISARTVYERASKGPAATLNPTDLHTAKESLDAAEQSFEKEGDTQVTRDLGYTAERRTETAESRARAMIAMTEKEQAVAGMHAATAAQGKMTAAQLAAANQALAGKDQALALQGNALQNEVQRLVIQCDAGSFATPELLSPRIRQVEGLVGRAGVTKGTLKEMMDSVEKFFLIESLREHGNNKTNSAKTLGITREGLHKKLRQFGI